MTGRPLTLHSVVRVWKSRINFESRRSLCGWQMARINRRTGNWERLRLESTDHRTSVTVLLVAFVIAMSHVDNLRILDVQDIPTECDQDATSQDIVHSDLLRPSASLLVRATLDRRLTAPSSSYYPSWWTCHAIQPMSARAISGPLDTPIPILFSSYSGTPLDKSGSWRCTSF